MNDNNTLGEEVFCLKYELNTLAEVLLKQQSERWVPGFLYESTDYSHLKRYKLASQYSNNKNVIDIACGTGKGSLIIATEGAANSVDGFDIQPDAIRYARWRNKSSKINFNVGDAINIDVVDKYDLAVSFETIEHLTEYKKFIENLFTCLKKDGLILVSTPISPLPFDSKPGNPYHTQEWGFQEFQDIFKEYFTLEKIYVQLYPLSPIPVKKPGLLSRGIKKIQRLASINSSVQTLNFTVGKFSEIEEFTGQYIVEELGKPRIGYQIVLGKKRNL